MVGVQRWTIGTLWTLYWEAIDTILTWLAVMVAKLVCSSWLVREHVYKAILRTYSSIFADLRRRKVAILMNKLHCAFRTIVTIRTSFHVILTQKFALVQYISVIIAHIAGRAFLNESLSISSCLWAHIALRASFLED